MDETDWPEALADMGDGRFVVAGQVAAGYSSTDWYEGAVVAEFSPQGETLWEVLYPPDPKSPRRGHAFDVVQTDGGCLAVGTYYDSSYDSNFPHALVMNLNGNGGVNWVNTYALSLGMDDLAWEVLKTQDGGYVVAGHTDNSLTGSGVWVFKLNVVGDVVWSEVLVGPGSGGLGDMKETLDGGLVLVGTDSEHYASYSFDNCEWDCARAWVIKLDSRGELVWQQSYGIDSPCTCEVNSQTGARSVAVAAGGDLVLEGYVSLPNGNWWIWVCKLSSTGSIKWQKYFSGGLGSRIVRTADGGYLVTGAGDARAFKISPTGDVLWGKLYGYSSESHGVRDVLEKPEGGYTIFLECGEIQLNPDFWYTPWIILGTDAGGGLEPFCRFAKSVTIDAYPGTAKVFPASFTLKYLSPMKRPLFYQAQTWPPVTVKEVCGLDIHH